MKLVLLTLVVALAGSCYGARILGLLTMPSRSHGILMERLMRELAAKGHHITYVTAAPPAGKEPIPNMRLIPLSGVQELLMQNGPKSEDGKEMNMLSLKGMSGWFMFFFTLGGTTVCDYILDQPTVKQLIHPQSDEQFDLILAETFLDESIIAGFSHRFNAPIVGVMSFMPNIWANYLTGNPAQSSYIPDPNLGYSSKMSFFERVHSFVFSMAWDFYHPTIYLSKQDTVLKKHFGQNTPPIHDILRKTSAVLVNHHYSLAFPRPNLPNMIEVAGMHINPVKPLPSDLKAYLDGAPEGVILFSLGSNLKSSDLSPEQLQSILQAFKRLPFKILWKFEIDELSGLPSNVKIGKWLPQSDILAHPNLKLFITHGGLLSTTEAVHRGVPVLGIPIFGDQPLNMKHTENAGLGRTFDLDDLTADSFYTAIMEVATNPSYATAAKVRSSVFRDTETAPIIKAVWWVEYVIRHKGAPHLQSAAQHLSWYQLHQLDVIAYLSAIVLVVSWVLIKSTKAILSKMCSYFCKETKTVKKSKKNN